MARPGEDIETHGYSVKDLKDMVAEAKSELRPAELTRFQERLVFVRCRMLGMSVSDASASVGISVKGGYNIQSMWNQYGPKGIYPNFAGGRKSKMSDEQFARFCEVYQETRMSAKEAQEYISNEFGIAYSLKQVYVLISKTQSGAAPQGQASDDEEDPADGRIQASNSDPGEPEEQPPAPAAEPYVQQKPAEAEEPAEDAEEERTPVERVVEPPEQEAAEAEEPAEDAEEDIEDSEEFEESETSVYVVHPDDDEDDEYADAPCEASSEEGQHTVAEPPEPEQAVVSPAVIEDAPPVPYAAPVAVPAVQASVPEEQEEVVAHAPAEEPAVQASVAEESVPEVVVSTMAIAVPDIVEAESLLNERKHEPDIVCEDDMESYDGLVCGQPRSSISMAVGGIGDKFSGILRKLQKLVSKKAG
ncbi:MAG: hypothetical protein LBT41_00515 [Candidatus Methanoplasma sp.]|jgi:putative transposase|nr:hypothetical protein [Candidatus Methanoplasma sp.]